MYTLSQILAIQGRLPPCFCPLVFENLCKSSPEYFAMIKLWEQLFLFRDISVYDIF